MLSTRATAGREIPAQTMIEILAQDWASLAMPLGVLAATLGAGYLIKRVMFGFLQRWSAVPRSGVAGIAFDVVRDRFMFWVLILALHLATRFLQLPAQSLGHAAPLLLGLWILSLAIPAHGSRHACSTTGLAFSDTPGTGRAVVPARTLRSAPRADSNGLRPFNLPGRSRSGAISAGSSFGDRTLPATSRAPRNARQRARYRLAA